MKFKKKHFYWCQIQIHQNFDNLPELHSLSCGLKALVTQESADAVDVLRRACGGLGFMSSSNLPRLWGLVTAACTYEGENTVLWLQVCLFSHIILKRQNIIKTFSESHDRSVNEEQLYESN